MRKIGLFFLSCLFTYSTLYAQEHKVFHTSICYDFLSSIQNYESVLDNVNEFSSLRKDTTFLSAVTTVNELVRASHLCNAYSIYPTDKENVEACISYFEKLDIENLPDGYQGKYLENIFQVKSDILYILNKLKNAGYEDYWHKSVYPKLKAAIDSYTFEEGLLDNIHNEIDRMAGGESLNEEYSKIYILDIDNAFALNDETFCCTYLLLDKEMAKQYRINFIQVYIHENLHRLYLCPELISQLDYLMSDEFYKKNELKAIDFGEGGNEAFVVAAETFISYKLGLKKQADVYTEFAEYIDGSLVLAPIIYIYLNGKGDLESYNEFLLKLFSNGAIKIGKIEEQYNKAMQKIQSNSFD